MNWHKGKAESRIVVSLEDDWVRCFSANAGTSEIAVGTAKVCSGQTPKSKNTPTRGKTRLPAP